MYTEIVYCLILLNIYNTAQCAILTIIYMYICYEDNT